MNLDNIDYNIRTSTGNKLLAGTNGNVYITIKGEKKSTKEIQLKSDSKKTFEIGNKDEFTIKAEDVGKVIHDMACMHNHNLSLILL